MNNFPCLFSISVEILHSFLMVLLLHYIFSWTGYPVLMNYGHWVHTYKKDRSLRSVEQLSTHFIQLHVYEMINPFLFPFHIVFSLLLASLSILTDRYSIPCINLICLKLLPISDMLSIVCHILPMEFLYLTEIFLLRFINIGKGTWHGRYANQIVF